MRENVKREIVAIVCAFTCTVNTLPVSAMDIRDNNFTIKNGEVRDVVYYDGVEYDVDLDVESGKIIVSGETDTSEGILVMTEGEATINIENDYKENEVYICDVNELTNDDVDIEMYDEEDALVHTYDEYEELEDDVYEGQTAIAVPLIVPVLATALLYIATAYIIRKSNVTYVMANYFTKAVEKAKEAVRTKTRAYYYPAIVSDNVYICPKGVNLNKAVALVKADGSVYSFTKSMAQKVITNAGYVPVDSDGDRIYELHNGKKQKGTFQFKHYHRGKTNSKGTYSKRGSCHSLFGMPTYIK